jgi:predicted nucleic acid-binding Zn ribbon protein
MEKIMGKMKKSFYNTYEVLCDWYGKNRADTEIVAYCPRPVSVGDTAEKILSGILSEETLQIMKLCEKWELISGRQIAAVSSPLNIKNRVVYVEVFHSAWLRELNGPVKKQLIMKIKKIIGDGFCDDIKFVPGGRSPDEK